MGLRIGPGKEGQRKGQSGNPTRFFSRFPLGGFLDLLYGDPRINQRSLAQTTLSYRSPTIALSSAYCRACHQPSLPHADHQPSLPHADHQPSLPHAISLHYRTPSAFITARHQPSSPHAISLHYRTLIISLHYRTPPAFITARHQPSLPHAITRLRTPSAVHAISNRQTTVTYGTYFPRYPYCVIAAPHRRQLAPSTRANSLKQRDATRGIALLIAADRDGDPWIPDRVRARPREADAAERAKDGRAGNLRGEPVTRRRGFAAAPGTSDETA